MVVGDGDGITLIPREKINEVFVAAEKKTVYEEKRRETIAKYEECVKNGMEPPERAPQLVLDMLK